MCLFVNILHKAKQSEAASSTVHRSFLSETGLDNVAHWPAGHDSSTVAFNAGLLFFSPPPSVQGVLCEKWPRVKRQQGRGAAVNWFAAATAALAWRHQRTRVPRGEEAFLRFGITTHKGMRTR